MDVAWFIGSESDFEVVKDGLETLKRYGLDYALEVTSAHRSPERTLKLIRDYEAKGVSVFIAVAGKAAHLAGVDHVLRRRLRDVEERGVEEQPSQHFLVVHGLRDVVDGGEPGVRSG